MSAIVPRELMVLVERVVRPLAIPLSRQKRLRTDFLEHLQTIHAEELARDDDSAAAIVRTHQRFGNPTELTAELRGTIRWWEPWECWIESFWGQRPSESVLWYVARIVSRLAIFLILLIAALMADHHVFGTQRFSLSQFTAAISGVIFLTVWIACFLLFGLRVGAEWDRPQRRWGRILLFSIALIASWPMSLSIMMMMAGGTWSEYAIPLISSVVGGVFSVIVGTVVGTLHRRETLYRQEWEQLKLDEV